MIRYFLVVLPGLEDLAFRELQEKCPLENARVLKGGIDGEGELEWMVVAHENLKIPTRILMRLLEFKAKDFPKLYQKLSTFPWPKYLSHPEPEWEISCSKSRLNHTGRIEETVKKALTEGLRRQPLSLDWKKKNHSPQTFYLRLSDDVATLSLDLTGDPLYKRDLQKIKGEAPLRENIAAALVYELCSGEETLIDPMCGSGTFLTEALTFYTPLHLRTFAFEEAPFFKGKTFKKTKTIEAKGLVKKAQGFDLNQDLLEKIKVSLPLSFSVQDSLQETIDAKDKIMICNPPYGERLKIKGKRGSHLKVAWEKFLHKDQPKKFGWLLPKDMDDLFQCPKGYREVSRRSFRNGGLAVTFWIWEKS
jgi:putative N6-adenine-specific DNA methylase